VGLIDALRPRAVVFTAALGCAACAEPPAAPAPPVAVSEPAPPPAPPAPPPEPVRFTLLAVGDVLPHSAVKAAARGHADQLGHDGWDAVFADVAPLVQAADVAFANMEAPIAPDAHRGVHGEVFNAPASLAPALAATGFDVLSMANNHVFDQGPAGVLETRTRIHAAGMTPVGAGATCAEAASAQIVDVAGVRVAFLASVDLLNLDERDGTEAPCVFVAGALCEGECGPDRDALHYRPDPDRLVAAVQRAREAADLVVMSFHWGNEYRTAPLPEYPPLARTLLDAGVDVLLGHHPHVLQPVERYTAADGRQTVVAYSLGNFVSNMGAAWDPASGAPGRARTRDGAALRVTFRADGGPRVESVDVVPLWTDNDQHRRLADAPAWIRVVPHAAARLAAIADPNAHPSVALLDQRRAEIATIIDPELLAAD
jgi:poly-gamma-glutamate capsule biosynthesis protein CapA/YwtB (metallophosphatase superfamily)